MSPSRNKWNNWQDIDWKSVDKAVFKLRKRIYKASQRGDYKAVHKLQRLLTKSYYGKLSATRKVTQDNQGHKTAGVDGIRSLTDRQRLELVDNLQLNGRSKPTRRVWIPKANEEKRPLGIPTMEDRVKQGLVKLALEPQWEAKFENNSYGFRPAMSCHDAIGAIYLAIKQKPKYVLDADIAKCFDKINHEKLLTKLETYPTLKRQIKAWLKSGVIDRSWSPTEEGTPQGGVVSPLLANIALHGLELEIKKYARTWKGAKVHNENSISIVRYADDFVVLHKDLDRILECKEIIENWLVDIGLELKPSKTHISHTLNEYKGKVGFDFLGFTVRQFPVGKKHSGKSPHGKLLGYKTIIKPSKDKIKAHIKKVGDVIRKHKSSPQSALISELNPIVRGWSNYYRAVCSSEEYSHCDFIMYRQLKRWAKRRHPNKSKTWVTKKYWHSQGNRNWVFASKEKGEINAKLIQHSETKIIRHNKVKNGKSWFDGDLIYWSTRMGKHPEMPSSKAKLLKDQKGKCKYCGLYFKDEDIMEVDHIIPKSRGGRDEYKNLQLLHRHCHDRKTANDGSPRRSKTETETSIHDKEFIREERYEVRVSRTVLKTSGSGNASA